MGVSVEASAGWNLDPRSGRPWTVLRLRAAVGRPRGATGPRHRLTLRQISAHWCGSARSRRAPSIRFRPLFWPGVCESAILCDVPDPTNDTLDRPRRRRASAGSGCAPRRDAQYPPSARRRSRASSSRCLTAVPISGLVPSPPRRAAGTTGFSRRVEPEFRRGRQAIACRRRPRPDADGACFVVP